MTSCQFNENTNPSEVYASAFPQGSAVVVTNTGVSDVSSCWLLVTLPVCCHSVYCDSIWLGAHANSSSYLPLVVFLSQGEVVEMGTFFNIFCFANVPYECEFVYDGAEVLHDGEFKCHICDIEGVRQDAGLDDDLLMYAILVVK